MIDKNSKSSLTIILLLLAFVILSCSYAPSKGVLKNENNVILAFLANFILLFLLNFSSKYETNKQGDVQIITTVIAIFTIITITMSSLFDGGIYFTVKEWTRNLQVIRSLGIFIAFFYILEIFKEDNLENRVMKFFFKYKFIILVLIAVFQRIGVIIFSPLPWIDVWYELHEGADDLLSLKNPYSQFFTQIYPERIHDMYAYPPVSLLVTAPFRVLFGDIRYGYIILEVIISYLFYRIVTFKKEHKEPQFKYLKISGELLAIIFLYNPSALLSLEQTWIETIFFFFVVLLSYFFITNSYILAFIILGILFGTKQYSVLFLPFLLKFKGKTLKRIILSFAVAFLIYLPFIIWSYKDLIFDIIIPHLEWVPPTYSICANSLYLIYFGKSIPYIFVIPLLAIVFIYIFIKQNSSLESFLRSFYIMLLFIFTLREGHTNYFILINNFILLEIAIIFFRMQK